MVKNQNLQNAVIYEIYPTSFYDSNGDGIGDIRGMIEKLPYIQQLGANVIWLNPLFESPFRDGGYDISDYYKVDPRFGTNSDLIEFFDKARESGIEVMLDLVCGHTSDRHPWFIESSKDPIISRNEWSDRYIWADNYTPERGELFIWGLSERKEKYKVNYYSSQPALNYGYYRPKKKWQSALNSPEALANRREVENICKYWLKLGASGFRVDMAPSMVKNDKLFKGSCAFWQDVIGNVKSDYPDCYFLSEWFFPNYAVGKAAFDMDFFMPIGFYRKNWSSDRDNERLYSDTFFGNNKRRKSNTWFYIQQKFAYRGAYKRGYYVMVLGNHDTIRHSRSRSMDMSKALFASYMTLPNVPLIYYGDEIGMKYLPLVSKDGGYERTGSRTPMQWNNGTNCGFSSCIESKLYLPIDNDCGDRNVESQINDDDSLFCLVKKLAWLKRTLSCLKFDARIKRYDRTKHDVLLYKRVGENDEMFVAINPNSLEKQLNIGRFLKNQNEWTIISNNTEPKNKLLLLGKESFFIAYRKFTG